MAIWTCYFPVEPECLIEMSSSDAAPIVPAGKLPYQLQK